MLTYQLHQINKLNKQQQQQQIIENPSGPVISARKKQFILNKPTQSLIYESNLIDKSLIEYDSAYINSKNQRKNSAYSAKSDQYSISDEQYPAGAACSLDTTKQQLINNQRLNSSSSHNSAAAAAAPNSTDRSLTPTIHSSTKILPPVVKRLSENVPPPDPKPFLQSAASTLHSRNKNHNSNNNNNNKELIQRRTLISLPPINKSFEVNHLIVVESPHKQNNNQNKIEHNNSSAN